MIPLYFLNCHLKSNQYAYSVDNVSKFIDFIFNSDTQATASFDSTDSASVSDHMLQFEQMRADSEYRSMENPVPKSAKRMYQQQHVTNYEAGASAFGETEEDTSDTEECVLSFKHL